MALKDSEIEYIKEVVHETQKFSPKTKLNEYLLQSGITLIGLFFLGVVLSGFCWLIVIIWNHIL
jgi:preprotein translocase subunit Sss1